MTKRLTTRYAIIGFETTNTPTEEWHYYGLYRSIERANKAFNKLEDAKRWKGLSEWNGKPLTDNYYALCKETLLSGIVIKRVMNDGFIKKTERINKNEGF
jgi:hypothetical protein